MLVVMVDAVVDSCDQLHDISKHAAPKAIDGKARIETMYLDKLDGCITQEFFDKHSATWRREQDVLLREIQEIQKATPTPLDQAVDTLRLTSL